MSLIKMIHDLIIILNLRKMIKIFGINFQFKIAILAMLFMLSASASGQIYYHSFPSTVVTYPYIAPPTTIDTNLLNSSWYNSFGEWEINNGLLMQGNSTATLTFDVAPGYLLSVSSFNFYGKKTSGGPQNWSMSINGIVVGSGLISPLLTGAEIGQTNASNLISGLTGEVTVVLTVSNTIYTGGYNFTFDEFKLFGEVIPICNPPIIASIFPNNGPENTLVKIEGSGFLVGSGTSSVHFNGVATTNFNVISDSLIEVYVPSGNTNGYITVITNDCESITGEIFTKIISEGADLTDLYMSEIYDSSINGAFIELYNGSFNSINLSGYKIKRYANIGDIVFNYEVNLTGTIEPGGIFIVGFDDVPCSVFYHQYHDFGINENDALELVYNNIILDLVYTPSYQGYSMIRNPDAIAPKTFFDESDWDILSTSTCENLGSHETIFDLPVLYQPNSQVACVNSSTTISFSYSDGTEYTYQWKKLDASGVWLPLANGAMYSGVDTNTLTINQVSVDLDASQFYCELVAAQATIVTNAAQIRISDGMLSITDFSYFPIICQNSTTIVPTTVTGFTIGGVFSSDSGLVINPNSGAINPSLSSLGLHVIEYSYGQGAEDCNGAGTSSFEIFIENSNEYITDFSYQTPICITEGNS